MSNDSDLEYLRINHSTRVYDIETFSSKVNEYLRATAGFSALISMEMTQVSRRHDASKLAVRYLCYE